MEEKRAKVLEIFHESSQVFQLKEVEKLAGKKGVTFQSVKDVVQSLVDDDLVHMEKIGQSNYLWSFPSEASVKIANNLKSERNRKESAQKAKTELEQAIEAIRASRIHTDETKSKLKKLEDRKATKAKLDLQMKGLEGSDAIRFASICTVIEPARDAANRWLDNVENLKDWTKKKFDGKDKEVEDFFAENGMKEDMEYFS